jgi:hypothetical protein
MKLYSIYDGRLISANVNRETKLYYFVDNSGVNRWSSRVNRSDVDVPPGTPNALVATTPLGAWQIEAARTRDGAVRFRELAEKADRAHATAKVAIEALTSQENLV